MDNKLTFIIDEQHDGKKVRDYLKEIADLSTRLIRGAAVTGRIKINNKIVKLNHVIKCQDVLDIYIAKEESQNMEPQDIPIQVVFEDSDIIVINKPPFMVVHPTKSHPEGTLANGVLYHFKQNNDPSIVRLVSRLDMDTSGLIVIAKNQYSHMFLAKEMEKNQFKKVYTAVVWGNIQNESDTLDLPIYRPALDSIKRVVDHRGQRSITHYKVIKHLKNADIVRLELETGRTHQIRVHLSHIGNPIIGDTLYGHGDDEKFINRQALHASEISFLHPKTKERITLTSELPDDLNILINKIAEGY